MTFKRSKRRRYRQFFAWSEYGTLLNHQHDTIYKILYNPKGKSLTWRWRKTITLASWWLSLLFCDLYACMNDRNRNWNCKIMRKITNLDLKLCFQHTLDALQLTHCPWRPNHLVYLLLNESSRKYAATFLLVYRLW